MNNKQVQSGKDGDSIFCHFNGPQFKNCMHSFNIYMYEQHFE